MDFAVMTEPHLGGTYEDMRVLARFAEDNGLVGFARSDHYYRRGGGPSTDAFACLAGLARDTNDIRLTVLVSPITFRHPAVIAKTAATIDEMSGGRLDLGVGTGWMEFEHEAFGLEFPEWGERFDRLTEALQYLRAALAGKGKTFEGDYYSLDAVVEPAAPGVRLIVGGRGPKRTPTLAGNHADEYNHFVAPPAELEPKIATMRAAADGRPVSVSVMGGCVVGRTDAEYRENLAAVATEMNVTSDELEALLRERGEPYGTPSQARETIAALEEVGVSKWYVQWLDINDVDGFARTIDVLRG